MHGASHGSTGHCAIIEPPTIRLAQTWYNPISKSVIYMLLYLLLQLNEQYQVTKNISGIFNQTVIGKIQGPYKISLDLPLHIPGRHMNVMLRTRTTPLTSRALRNPGMVMWVVILVAHPGSDHLSHSPGCQHCLHHCWTSWRVVNVQRVLG